MDSHESHGLAMKIIEKEIELETSCNLQVFQSLIENYKKIIEHYEEMEDSKYLDYQERLQKIFMRPCVLKMMEEDNYHQKYQKRSQPLFRRHTDLSTVCEKTIHKSHTLSATKHNLDADLSPKQQKVVSRMLENQYKRTEHVTSRAMSDLHSQEFSLKDRLENRKRLNTSTDSSFFSSSFSRDLGRRSFNQNASFCLEFESEKSAGSSFSFMSSKVEKIIEDNFNEKTEKISEIKIKYENQISELEAEGEICMPVIQELRRLMSIEIEEQTKLLNEKRKHQITQAKSEYI
jgi:hypothetical protein